MDQAKSPRRRNGLKRFLVVCLLCLEKICDLVLAGLQRLVFGPPSKPKGAYWAKNERGQWELRVPYRGEKSPPKWRY